MAESISLNTVPVFGTPGSGNPGRLIASVSPDQDTARSVALQTDGKIVVAGYARNGDAQDFALVRVNPDGSLDDTFGEVIDAQNPGKRTGKLLLDVGGEGTTTASFSPDYAYDVVIQPDGKITVVGGDYGFKVVRLNADGSLGTGFGDEGKLLLGAGSYLPADTALAAILQTDGQLLVAGKAYNDFAVVRLNANGSLDVLLRVPMAGEILAKSSPDYDANEPSGARHAVPNALAR